MSARQRTARPHVSLPSLLLIPAIQTGILSSLTVSAYIPAMPINDTSGLNMTDGSSISIAWTGPPAGVYSGPVSYQLQSDTYDGGTTSGALVHFTESTMGPNLTTETPWIAYVSCDLNESIASMEWDIFTLARDRGAVSALLYTATSQTCLLNEDYIQNFEKPLDVFATKTVQVARVIDNQWSHTNASFYYYNGTMLNISGSDVNQSLSDNAAPTHKTYLIGTLTARNSTGQAPTPIYIPNASASPSASPSHSGTPASMIALYTITGIISALFILMIVLGARRALRNPERYGRRAATENQTSQTTAAGLAQAILDTFPVIKFSRTTDARQRTGLDPKRMSSEAHLRGVLPELGQTDAGYGRGAAEHDADPRESIALRSLYTEESASFHSALDGPSGKVSLMGGDDMSILSDPRRWTMSPGPSRTTSIHDLHESFMERGGIRGGTGDSQIVHAEDATEDQCPICLLDFETGDNLRILPCEKEHVYHQACIDPWLLEVSGSCPLCRKDFNNPNPSATPVGDVSMGSQSSNPTSPMQASSTSSAPTASGFARYLAFMRRERNPRSRERSSTHRRSRAGTAASGGSGDVMDSGVGPGRRREADQGGPGGY